MSSFLECKFLGLSFFVTDSPFLDPPLIFDDTLAPLTPSDHDEVDHTRLTNQYPDGYTDTYGLRSGRGFIFKTGPAWPQSEQPDGRPQRRELRPVNNHPIMPAWDDTLTRIETCLQEDKLPFTAVMPLGFANVGEGKPFCPLVVAIGVEPTKVAFKDAKTVAESVKLILADTGFDDIEVAIWEFETFLSGLNLPALDPRLCGTGLYDSLAEFNHPFTSTLGIPVAPLKYPMYEGSLGLFLRRGTEVLGLTTAHVARPPTVFPHNKGLSLTAATKHHEGISALGHESYAHALQAIQEQSENLGDSIKAEEMKSRTLRARLGDGGTSEDERTRRRISEIEETIKGWEDSLTQLKTVYARALRTPVPKNRLIGHVVYADAIGASSNGPDTYTQDWAVIGIHQDAFDSDFKGNAMYIGTSAISVTSTCYPDIYLALITQGTISVGAPFFILCFPIPVIARVTHPHLSTSCASVVWFP